LEQIVLQELRPSPAIHIILIDMTGFYRGEGRGFFMILYKNNLCSLVRDGSGCQAFLC
jgi:hypothetical protein